MDKIKISQVADELALGKTAIPELIDKAKEMGLKIRNASSTITPDEASMLAEFMSTGINPNPPKPPKEKSAKATKTKTQSKEKPQKESSPQIEEKPKVKSTKKASAKASEELTESLEESLKQEAQSQSTQSSTIEDSVKKPFAPTKSGLVVVSKGKDSINASKQESRQDNSALLGEKQGAQKKPKQKPITPTTPRTQETKLDIGLGALKDFSSSKSYDFEEDEVLLFDMNEQELRDEEEEVRAKKEITDRVAYRKKNTFMNEGGIKRRSKRKAPPPKEVKIAQSAIVIPEEVRVYEFADLAGRELKEVITCLFKLGMMVTKNDFLDKDAIEILADEFKIDVQVSQVDGEFEIQNESDSSELRTRPPVVTIMGHVDHGKTSLLDYIRHSRVASGEAGGITQHIGAYSVEKDGKIISFIDTPGHEAFSAMRSRGAKITDIAIIVIAADDGVKAQTKEALHHAKEAGVSIIIAMNKMDKENANVDKLKAECAEIGFTPNDWGGEYEFIPISAKSGMGVDTLLETILIQAEVLDLKASYTNRAKAIVLEGSLEKGRGPVATIIVQDGVLKVGDSIVAGTAYGRVRALLDDMNRPISSLNPSGVALITGLSEVPSAGAILSSVDNDAIAKEYATKRALYLRQKELSKSTKISFDELSDMVAKGLLKTLPIILKTDTQGSLEAIKSSLQALNNEEVKIEVISSSVGGITEGDVDMASSSPNTLIMGFNVRPTGVVKDKAKSNGLEIKTYSVIYSLLDDVKALISGLMSPVYEEENTGQAEVRDTFSVAKVGVIAGCMVTDGKIERGIKVRLIRNGVVIHTGAISSLKRFKDDAKEVSKGYECGIMLENYNDIKIGDVFETFREVAKKVKL